MDKAKLAWVVRANPHHISRITEFLKRDLVALGWPGLGSIAGKDIDEIRAALLRSYGKLDNRELGASAGALDMLVNRDGKLRRLDELIPWRRSSAHG